MTSFRKQDANLVVPEKPLSAFALRGIVNNLQACNEHRLPAASWAADVKKPVVMGSLGWKGHPRWWDVSPEAGTIEATYCVQIDHAAVQVKWRAMLLRGNATSPPVFLDLSSIRVCPALGSRQYYTDTIDLAPIHRAGYQIAGIQMWIKSNLSGVSAGPDLDLSGRDAPEWKLHLTSTMAANFVGHAELDPYKLTFQDASKLNISGLQTHQIIWSSGDTLHVWPMVPRSVWDLDNPPRAVFLEQMGKLSLFNLHFEEVHGTPYGEGQRFPVIDAEALAVALGPGMPPSATLVRQAYKAGEYLFVDRTAIQAWGPVGRAENTLSKSDNDAPKVQCWGGVTTLDVSTEEVLWTGRVNDANESSYITDAGVSSGRGGYEVIITLLPLSDKRQDTIPMDVILEGLGPSLATRGTVRKARAYAYGPNQAWEAGSWLASIYRTEGSSTGVAENNLQPLFSEEAWRGLGVVQFSMQIIAISDLEYLQIRVQPNSDDVADSDFEGHVADARTLLLDVLVRPIQATAFTALGV